MKHSLSYYIVLFILRVKGIKKDFSKDPIDYKKIRKEDIYEAKGKYFANNISRKFEIRKTKITEVKRNQTSNSLVLFIHGGAFISGPTQLHWDTIKELSKQSDHTIWMCDYPKAPKHKIFEILENIDAVYQAALEKYPANEIILIGDSVGGTLIAALTQRLVQKSMALPSCIILVSPVMDATLSNPQIDLIDSTDPMLSKAGVKSAKMMCAEQGDLKNAMLSPINGSFRNFPKTILFLATNDITFPDQLLAVEKLKKAKVNVEVITGENMPHIWPFLPMMKEAKTALTNIIKILNS